MESNSRFPDRLASLMEAMDDAVFSMERWFVLACDALRRAAWRLDPRLYSESRRIQSVTEGVPRKALKKVVVFVIYTRSMPANFTMNFIAALNRHAYDVIVVSNAELGARSKAMLLSNCCLLVERANLGQDFGGYKDGISIAFRRFPEIERLIIANDSLYYLDEGLDELIDGLDGAEDFIGVSEVYDHHYHVASFLLSFGRGVLVDPVFRRFWAGYRPIPSRMWTILQGEGELTRLLVDAGHRPHILYPARHLLPKLKELSSTEVQEALALFPIKVRKVLSAIVDRPSGSENGIADDFAAAVVKEVMKRNQMHTAGFAFMKYNGLPVMKRDIVYRELFTLDEVSRILTDFGEPMRDEIVADLARRPPPSRSDVLRRLFYRHGQI